MRTYVPVITALTAALLPLEPVSGLAGDNVQAAIEELAGRSSGGGGEGGPVQASAVSVDPIEGLTAADAQSALVELAGRPSGGGAELPNASTVPVRPALIEFTVPDGIAPPTFGFYLQLGQITYPNGSNGSETYRHVFERVGSHNDSDENGNVVAITVDDDLKVRIALNGPLRMTGPAAEQFGISDQVFMPRAEVEADTDADHVRAGDETLSEKLDRIRKLPNSGTLPGAPASVTVDVGAMMWPQPWDTIRFTVGDRYHPDISAESGESWTDFFARIGGLGLADFNDENPLTVIVNGNAVTLSSTTRLRSTSGFFFTALGQQLDVSPKPAVKVDTNSTAVAHAGEKLSAVVDRLIARPAAPDPRSVIRGVRSHDGYPTLVSKGATAGDQLNISVGSRSSSLVITETASIVEVSAWLRESPVLNPDGVATEIDCDFDALRAVVIWSKSGQPISMYSSNGDGSGLAALLGSLPQ